MRTYQEVSHIVVQLLSLDEINEFLHNVFDEISLVKQKGVLWVEEKETSTFTELKEYITDKTSEILRRCISVASTLVEKLDDTASDSNQVDQKDTDVKPVILNVSTSAPKENHTMVGKMNENCNTLQAKQLEKLQQKVEDQQLINKILEEKTDTFIHNYEKENQLKLKEFQENLDEKLVKFKEEMVTELHSASIFMTHLQTEWETLLKEQKENNEGNLSQDTKAEVNDKIEKLTQEQKNLSNTLDDIIETHDRLEFEKEQFKKDLSDYKKKTDDLAKNVDNTIEKELKEIKASQTQVLSDIKNAQREIVRLNENSEFLCDVAGQCVDNCVQDCPHIIGYHEQQISEGEEVDLLKYFKDCKKNPGHSQFIPVDSFSYTHLPRGYNEKDVYDLINSAASLTVRISVTLTSPRRPDVWPNTKVPYFLYNMRGSQHLRIGSGIVTEVKQASYNSCPCNKCQHSDTPSQDWWRITVRTAANLVFDDIEASHATVKLFYDKEPSSTFFLLKSVENEIFLDRNISDDWCTFDCVTCDAKLGDLLKTILERFKELTKKVTEKYKNSQNVDKLMFIVSHPHGCRKQISVGQWKANVSKNLNKFVYSTCTCPGSAGAIAYFVGDGGRVHCGKINSGLNYCSG